MQSLQMQILQMDGRISYGILRTNSRLDFPSYPMEDLCPIRIHPLCLSLSLSLSLSLLLTLTHSLSLTTTTTTSFSLVFLAQPAVSPR